MTEQVVVVIGVGGMGEAIARRQGPGRKLLVADFNQETLESLASSLTSDGYDVSAQHVDVGSPESVHALAQAAVVRRSRYPARSHRRSVADAGERRSDSAR